MNFLFFYHISNISNIFMIQFCEITLYIAVTNYNLKKNLNFLTIIRSIKTRRNFIN